MSGNTLACGPAPDALVLHRAGRHDLDAIVALQFRAYAQNRDLLGLEPLPLQANYENLFSTHEMWTITINDGIAAALILEVRPSDLLIWSVATDPDQQNAGLGPNLLRAAEARARDLGRSVLRLYTGATLEHLIAWYGRHGFDIERTEQLGDREIVHMIKRLS